MMDFAREALQAVLDDPTELQCLLGEYLSEPKANVWFESAEVPPKLRGVSLDRRTRMLFHDQHVFINGESFRAAGRDAELMRTLTDQRSLSAAQVKSASSGAKKLMQDWLAAGWLHDAD